MFNEQYPDHKYEDIEVRKKINSPLPPPSKTNVSNKSAKTICHHPHAHWSMHVHIRLAGS